MKIAMAKELLRSGAFRNAQLVENPMGPGWILQMNRSMLIAGNVAETLSSDKGETRVFKSLEAGYKASKEIGFNGVYIGSDAV